ncbi:MAG: AI-2E family transporter [Rhizonema sp. PD37]|nr:AI-2E family transporter [Rhizonema sp. PD37]
MRRATSIQRLLIYGLSGPVIALNIWLLSSIFQYFQHPFTILAVAAILAFLLSYPVKFFERAPMTRSQAVIIVLLATLTLLVILGVTLVPMVLEQTNQLLRTIPSLLESSQKNLLTLQELAKKHNLPLDLHVLSTQINANIEGWAQQLATNAVGVAGTLLSGLLDLVLVVVLAFYMLLYGKQVWLGLINLLPSNISVPFTTSLRLNFQKFFISQLLLGLFMVVTLTPIFLILKVPFALLFAILIGLSELIPFIGATLGIGLVTILILLQQQWLLAAEVAGAAVVMQQLKDNLLAPRLLGEFIGLNPIWIFVSILMGFEIGKLLGTVVAVPIAGTIKGTFDALKSNNSVKESELRTQNDIT